MKGGISAVSGTVPVDECGDDRDVFECQICMETPRNSVLTTCGHLFCWSCLYMWLQNEAKPCPLCKLTLTKASVIPVYGCQKGSSKVESSVPPRPSAPLSSAQPITHPESSESSSSLPRPLRHRLFESLRTRARADFRAIRQFHPPSPTAWIAEASANFDPSVRSRDDDGVRPTDDIQIFISNVLIPRGEYCPGIHDFRMSWLQYYEARIWGISPPRSALQHYDEFLQSWGRQFHEAWDRAGRPSNRASFVEAFPEESQGHGTLHGGTSSEESVSTRHASVVSPMEVELEVNDELVSATESRRMVSRKRRSGRENRRASRRPRPY